MTYVWYRDLPTEYNLKVGNRLSRIFTEYEGYNVELLPLLKKHFSSIHCLTRTIQRHLSVSVLSISRAVNVAINSESKYKDWISRVFHCWIKQRPNFQEDAVIGLIYCGTVANEVCRFSYNPKD